MTPTGRGRRIPGRRAAAVLAVLLLAACADLITNTQPYGSIEVTAVLTNGDPLPGVQLMLYTSVRTMAYGSTGPDGKYVFKFVPEGAYGVQAIPPNGYSRAAGTPRYIDGLHMSIRGHKSLKFTYVQSGSAVAARVEDDTGAPVPGAGQPSTPAAAWWHGRP